MSRRIQMSSYSRIGIISFVAFGLVSATALSNAIPAAAGASHLAIWSIPAISFIGDGTPQVLGVRTIVDPGEFVDHLKVVIDEGECRDLTAEVASSCEKVYQFDANGDVILPLGPGFVDVWCSATFFDDPYTIGESEIECRLTIDKEVFDVGQHTTKVYLYLASGTFTDTGKFTLKATTAGLADIVAKKFTAPNSADQGDIKRFKQKAKNEGDKNAKGFRWEVSLPDNGKKVIIWKWIPILKEGKTKVFWAKGIIPTGYPSGPDTFTSFLDAKNQVGEQDETNNKKTRSVLIT
jgi:CARDB protein